MKCNNCSEKLKITEKISHLNEEEVFILKHPKKVFNVNYQIRLDNGKVKTFSGYRIQYNDALGPTKGGIRFHQDVDLEEVSELAFLMSLKNSLAGIPYGGAKGGISFNPKEYSKGEIERISRGYVKAIHKNIGEHIDIPAPDVNTTPEIMAWMTDEYEKIVGHKAPGVFTGKPVEIGGSLGRGTSTARGGFFIIEEIYKNIEKEKLKVAIQGFGNAGQHIATFLSNIGFKIIAVSDSSSGLYNENGLDIENLIKYKENKGKFSMYDNGAKLISNNELLELECEILVPAALGHVITKENAQNIKAKTILELANAPIEPTADKILDEKKITIIPDILANSGGVIVSYFEWVQNLQNYYWTEDEVNSKLKYQILKAYENVLTDKNKYELSSLREAAYSVAIKRILTAEKLKGNL